MNHSFKINVKSSKSDIIQVLALLFFTLISQGLSKSIYIYNPTIAVPDTLSVYSILTSFLAALFMWRYLTHINKLRQVSIFWILALSIFYGNCSFAVSQENQLSIRICYALFPLLFYMYDSIALGINSFYFVALLAICLIITPAHALSVWSILLILTLINTCAKKTALATALQQFLMLILAFFIAAFRIISHFVSVSAQTPITYSGFSVSFSPFVWLSRLLSNSVTSIALTDSNGFNLYFGLFFLLMVILYLSHHTDSKCSYIANIFGILFSIFAMTYSPVRFLVSFGQTSQETVSFAYVFVFFALLLAKEGIYALDSITIKQFVGVISLYVGILCGVLLFASHNFVSLTLYSSLLFGIIYLILITVIILSKKASIPYTLLACLFTLELCLNTLVCTNMNLIPDTCSTQDDYSILSFLTNSDHASAESLDESSETTTIEATTRTADTTDEADYNTFISEHRDRTLESILFQLDRYAKTVDITNKLQQITSYPNDFDRLNASCHSLGAPDLFTSIPCEIQFAPCDDFSIHKVTNNASIYAFKTLHSHGNADDEQLVSTSFRIVISPEVDYGKYLLASNVDGTMLVFGKNEISSTDIPLQLPSSTKFVQNLHFQVYAINEDLVEKLPDVITYALSHNSIGTTSLDYLGLIISFIAITVFILCFMKRTIVLETIGSKSSSIAESFCTSAFATWFKQQYVYVLSFSIPLLLFILTMIIADCKPFGTCSFFDQDGLGLTLPSYMDAYYNLQKGNTFVSLNGGYGYSLYTTNPFIFLLIFYKLLPATAIEPLLLLGEGICIGLCGLFMAYYLTHRLNAKKAFSKHPLVIASGCVYAMNAYMLSMHGFTSWYFVLMLTPLIILALDYLIYERKVALYIALLSYCMMTNFLLTLYICLFLIIWFFTYKFNGIKEFFQKGILFAVSSLLCVGNSIFIFVAAYFGTYYSNYQSQDSQFPSLGLHTNYLNILKQHMIFPYTTAVTSDDGYASIYCGIITMILLIFFVINRNITITNKLRKLIPICILYWCFNGKVMSFIWNGFHYQSKVPNRYAFLFMFVMAELIYDVLIIFDKEKRKFLICSASILTLIFVTCRIYDKNLSNVSLIASILIIVVFAFFALFATNKQFLYATISLIILELSANMIYTTMHHYSLTNIQTVGNYSEIAEDINENLIQDGTFSRVQFPSYHIHNSALYNAPSANLFNSFISLYQTNTNNFFGYLSGVNLVYSNHNASILSNMLSASQYIMYPIVSNDINLDLDQYTFIGNNDTYFILQSPYAVSLGYFLPLEALQQQEIMTNCALLWNELFRHFTGDEDLLSIQPLAYDASGSQKQNSYFFTDCDDKILGYDQVQEYIVEENQSASTVEEKGARFIRLHVNFIADADGIAYLLPNEYVALKEVKKGEHVSMYVSYPNASFLEFNQLRLVIQKSEQIEAVYNGITQNQLENISIHDNTIEGTVDYDKAGYTFYSLAYDKSWHAYIDGKEVEVEDPYYSCLAVKTPAGKHTITLKYIPYGMKESVLVSLLFIILSAIFSIFITHLSKRPGKEIIQDCDVDNTVNENSIK